MHTLKVTPRTDPWMQLFLPPSSTCREWPSSVLALASGNSIFLQDLSSSGACFSFKLDSKNNHTSFVCCCVLQPLSTQSLWKTETMPSANVKSVKGSLVSTHFLSTNCLPGTVLGAGENEGNKVPTLKEFMSWGVDRRWKAINTHTHTHTHTHNCFSGDSYMKRMKQSYGIKCDS